MKNIYIEVSDGLLKINYNRYPLKLVESDLNTFILALVAQVDSVKPNITLRSYRPFEKQYMYNYNYKRTQL